MKVVNKYHTRCPSFNIIPLNIKLLKHIKNNVMILHIYRSLIAGEGQHRWMSDIPYSTRSIIQFSFKSYTRLYEMNVLSVCAFLWCYFVNLKKSNKMNICCLYFHFHKSCIWVLNKAKVDEAWRKLTNSVLVKSLVNIFITLSEGLVTLKIIWALVYRMLSDIPVFDA